MSEYISKEEVEKLLNALEKMGDKSIFRGFIIDDNDEIIIDKEHAKDIKKYLKENKIKV